MATGYTTTGSLADSLDTVVDSARIIHEYKGVMSQLVERTQLPEGTGLDWGEVAYAKLTASTVTETMVNENYQQLSDTAISITPTMVQIATLITDRLRARITPKGLAKIGMLSENAILRKIDEDGLAVLDTATTSLVGAGSTLASGYIGAATRRIKGNTTETIEGPVRAVLHSYQVHDLQSEIVASVGTYSLTPGRTAEVFQSGFKGFVLGAEIFEDGNITIDSSDDAKGGVFAQSAIVLVEGMNAKVETERKPGIGGGSDIVYVRREYAYGERYGGVGMFEIYSDATAPTS